VNNKKKRKKYLLEVITISFFYLPVSITTIKRMLRRTLVRSVIRIIRPIPSASAERRPPSHSPCLFENNYSFQHSSTQEFLIYLMNNQLLESVLLQSPSTGGPDSYRDKEAGL